MSPPAPLALPNTRFTTLVLTAFFHARLRSARRPVSSMHKLRSNAVSSASAHWLEPRVGKPNGHSRAMVGSPCAQDVADALALTFERQDDFQARRGVHRAMRLRFASGSLTAVRRWGRHPPCRSFGTPVVGRGRTRLCDVPISAATSASPAPIRACTSRSCDQWPAATQCRDAFDHQRPHVGAPRL